MNNMTELLNLHEVVDLDSFGFAHTIDIVSRKIDKHDVLCSVLLGCSQLLSQ